MMATLCQVAPTHRQVAPTHRQVASTHRQVAPTLRQVAPTLRQVAPTLPQVAPILRQVAPLRRSKPAPARRSVPSRPGGSVGWSSPGGHQLLRAPPTCCSHQLGPRRGRRTLVEVDGAGGASGAMFKLGGSRTDGNPIKHLYEMGKQVATGGPEGAWRVYEGHRKSDGKVGQLKDDRRTYG